MNEKCELLEKITQVSFSLDDCVLFLDTHPNDTEALSYYEKLRSKRRALLSEYQQKYGPLTDDCVQAGTCWTWTAAPWPWTYEAN